MGRPTGTLLERLKQTSCNWDTAPLLNIFDEAHLKITELEKQVAAIKALPVYEGGDMMRGMTGDFVSLEELQAVFLQEKSDASHHRTGS